MYDDLTKVWDKVWADMTSLKLGVPVKGVSAELRAGLDKLKADVTSWQQYVDAYNAAGADKQATLQEKVTGGGASIITETDSVKVLLDKQIAANKAAPLGQFQMPQDSPAAKANPGLGALASSLAAAGTALEIEMSGDGGGAKAAPIEMPVKEETLPAPSWLKSG